MLIRVVAILAKLLMRFDPEQYRVHESPADLAAPFEHEQDDEHEDGQQSYARKSSQENKILTDSSAEPAKG
jgi:hypothetical protein